MATAEQLKALIRSHAEGDDARFYSVAMQVAAQEARQGHTKYADELRAVIDEAKAGGTQIVARSTKPVPLAQPRGELAGLLSVAYPKQRLVDMALAETLRARLERIVVEQRQQDRLLAHGYPPQRKILLKGPPGTGKTMTAAVLAGELGLPLFSIQLDGLITKFMGETAAKLRLIFDAMQGARGVFLFDEFDALGGERASRNDVGEIRRVLNSFLQLLEHDQSPGLLVAATNHPQILDRALFRRFDTVLDYSLPGDEVAERVMRGRLAALDTTGVDWQAAVAAGSGLSHGDLTRACEQAAKDVILAGTTAITTDVLIAALDDRRAAHE